MIESNCILTNAVAYLSVERCKNTWIELITCSSVEMIEEKWLLLLLSIKIQLMKIPTTIALHNGKLNLKIRFQFVPTEWIFAISVSFQPTFSSLICAVGFFLFRFFLLFFFLVEIENWQTHKPIRACSAHVTDINDNFWYTYLQQNRITTI